MKQALMNIKALGSVFTTALVAVLIPIGTNATLIALPDFETDKDVASFSVIDFNQFSSYHNPYLDGGAVQVGDSIGEDVTLSSETQNIYEPAGVGPTTHGLGSNGQWLLSKTPFVVQPVSATDSFTFHFNDGPVSWVGGFLNYAPSSSPLDDPYHDSFGPVFIEALDIFGDVLESYDLTISAPIYTPQATDDGAFRGISRIDADISAFRVRSNAYAALDDLTIARVPVPEPSTIFLIGTGLIGLAGWGRRKFRKSCR